MGPDRSSRETASPSCTQSTPAPMAATMQIYGECRTTDHRADAAGWGDITSQLVS